MKHLFLLSFIALVFILAPLAAVSSEAYFKFTIDSREELGKITKLISIDNVEGNTVFAYANERQFQDFRDLGYSITVLPHPGTLIEPEMAVSKDDIKAWDSYPTYTAYVDMMYEFESDFPGLCEIVNAGQTVEGRDILFARISDNLGSEEDEPEVMFTSTMHGNETTGYILMLRLIDSLLNAYGTDSLVTRLVDSCEIWINPLANPDGTYAGGNSSVSGATRYNANGVDINRNFPDPQDGDHPDGYPWQPETIVMMNLAEANKFVISANFHGGAEVVNYPWDTWSTLHADNQWYIDVSQAYADTVHAYSSGYMDGFNDGITNGYAWYEVDGGRQDYMNWWHGCREVTIELSTTMLLPGSQLPAHWIYNRSSFLNWFENGLNGIRGIITDAVTSLPLDATITIVGHDFDNSQVKTDPDVGDYHRMIEAGTYTVEISAPGYVTHTENNVTVTDNHAVRLDVALQPLSDDPVLVFQSHNGPEAGPGDTVSLNITLKNNGGGNAYNTLGILSTTDPDVSVTQNSSTFPTITAEGGTAISTVQYEFIISEESSNYRYFDLTLDVTADGGYSEQLNFNYFIGTRTQVFYEDFSFEQGWSGLGGSGEWQIGPATGGTGGNGTGDPASDHTPTSDNYLMGNDLTAVDGAYSSGLSTTYWITSPYIDCSNFSNVGISFYRWLGVESSSYDHAYFDVYDGTSWTTLFQNSGTMDESSWSEQVYDVAAYADSNPDFRIRFGIGPTDGSQVYCGWNIDDIIITGYGEGTGGEPELSYTPDDIRDSLQPGDTDQKYLKIYNNGSALLRIMFNSTDSWIDFDRDQHNIDIGDSLILPVEIVTEGLTPGDHTGEITFTSNDPDLSSGDISVNLHIYAPDIFLPETSISETLETDGQSSQDFIISNNGPGRLDYAISRQMFNGKAVTLPISSLNPEPIGYRPVDRDESGSNEPFFGGVDKSAGGPDTWGYSWVDSDDPAGPDFGWIDISTVGTEVSGLGDDDTTGAIVIGFDFPFYENSYSSIYIGSNGILSFDSGVRTRTNVAIPNSATPNNYIAMWWDDLDPRQGGNIYYYYDASEARFVVSFVSIRNYTSSGGTGSLTFQAILYPNGRLLLQYLTMDPGSDADGLSGATIGIENDAGDDGLQVVYNAAYMHDNLAVSLGAAGWLNISSASGSVDPYASDTIAVSFDAADLNEGEYTGQLTIVSNDPDLPTQNVPVTLTVENQLAPPPAPTPVYPADGAEEVALPIAFDWDDLSGVDNYALQIDSNISFTEPVKEISMSVSTYEVSDLLEGTTYYWRVQAHNAAGWGEWSTARSFATELAFICGDVNQSGGVNILDATYLINYLYLSGPAPVPQASGDVNNSGSINILDVTYLINYLYKSGPQPVCP
nr:carboxypeptidase regulatory-like domain-containing protein [candidate division Zixibacteria bacterium]